MSSVFAEPENINYGDTTQITINGFVNIVISPTGSVINIVQNGNDFFVTVNPILSTLYIVTGTDISGNQIEASVTVYVNVTANKSTVNANYNQSIILQANGSTKYLWYPSTYLNTISGSIVICTPLKNITYTIQGTDIYNVVTITYITVDVNTYLYFTPTEPKIFDGNLLELSVEYNNPYNYIASDLINYTWTSKLFTGLPPNCITSKNGSTITLHPYNTTYYTVNAYNNTTGELLSTNIINIIVIPKPSSIIDIDIIPVKLKGAVFNRNKKELVKLLLEYKVLSKKIIDFYYTTLQFAYRYEFTDKNSIPFKVKWYTIYQVKNNTNEMILSFEQQWNFFQYINQYNNCNFKFLLNTINEIYLSKPQKIRLMPLGITT
jgi:hypothetical protein